MPSSNRSLLRRASASTVLLCLLAVPALHAQTATLVRDIEPRGGSGVGPFPRQLTPFGSRMLFSADAGSGPELWSSDGTAVGTQQISDACIDGCGSFPSPLGKAGGTLFWLASLLNGERQLWRSDGTRAGTFALTPAEGGVRVEFYAGTPTYALTEGLLLFIGCTDAAGCEPWASDGTLAGTRLVKDITPGPDGSFLTLRAALGRVFIAKQIAPTGPAELWSSDGTAAGTVLVHAFDGSRLEDLTSVGGRLFFTRQSAAEGLEIWTSDGSSAGTRPLTLFPDIGAVLRPAGAGRLKPSGDGVYFVAADNVHGEELWRSDGTVDGTRRLTDFAAASPFPIQRGFGFVAEVAGRTVFLTGEESSGFQLWVAQGRPVQVSALPNACEGGCRFPNTNTLLVRAGGRVLFTGTDGLHGRELWSTDGTQAGTRIVRDLCPGPCSGAALAADSDTGSLPLLFLVTDRAGRLQLAQTDGTPAGTRQLTAFAGADSSLYFSFEARSFVLAGGRAYFEASDSNGIELWTADGVAPPRQVADLQHEGGSSEPTALTPLAGRIAFVAKSYPIRQVWSSDGTSDGTLPFPADPPYTSPFVSGLTALGGRLFFLVDPGGLGGNTLWTSDGAPAGTLPLLEGQHPDRLTPFRGQLYFRTFDPATQRSAIGRSDGTPGGTVTALTFAGDPAIQDLKAVGDSLYYRLTATEPTPAQLWKTDGTPAGTLQLADLPTIGDETLSISALGSRVYFLVNSALWLSDGTGAGTLPVHDHPGSMLSDLVTLGGALFYLLDGQGGRELWRSDGSEPGTVRVAAFDRFPALEAEQPPLTVAAGRLYFTALDAASGIELWTSDGTPAGTRRVLDVYPGPLSAQPRELTEAGGRLFFTASDGRHGRELWQSDGTAAGTRLVQDIAPLLAPSSPGELTPVGDRLYFAADDGLTGRELWMLPLGAQGCVPASDHLCLGGDDGRRYRVEALWRDPDGNSGRGTALPLTADTGTFWFFSPSNLEVVIKVLNGVGVNGHTWVFYGALSDVQYDLVVTDTQTGLTRQYSNLQGRLASVGDTQAFGPLGAALKATSSAPSSPPPHVETRHVPIPKAGCQASASRLCLNGGRFAVEVAWKDFQGQTGKGTALPLTGDTGTFWFFDANNLELVVKALDGRAVNGHYWIFFGALSNVEYTLRVTDT